MNINELELLDSWIGRSFEPCSVHRQEGVSSSENFLRFPMHPTQGPSLPGVRRSRDAEKLDANLRQLGVRASIPSLTSLEGEKDRRESDKTEELHERLVLNGRTPPEEPGRDEKPNPSRGVPMSAEPNAHPLDRVFDLACGVGWNSSVKTEPLEALRLLRSHPEAVARDLFLSTLAGDLEAVRNLVRGGADVREKGGPRSWDPLLYLSFSLLHQVEASLSEAQCTAARLLLESGADPNTLYTDPNHPGIPFPALYGTLGVSKHLSLAEVLLDKGAKPSDTQSLYHACEWFDLAPLELLGRYDLDPDDVSYCIKHALDMGFSPGVRWFLEKGADPNALHPGTGQTTLHWAVLRGAGVDIVSRLLEAGADPNARSKRGTTAYDRKEGGTPLDLALYTGQLEVATLLGKAGAIPTPPETDGLFLQACAAGDLESARALLESTPDLIQRLDPRDRNRIADVAQLGTTAGVRAMIAVGFEIDARGWMGATPLHWAACRAQAELLDLLLTNGAPQVDVGGYFGTPLHTVIHCQWEKGDPLPILRRLLESGATIPPDLGETGRPEIDRFLEEWRRR